jgi:polysaccharide biosynthesis/export protein
MKNISSHQSPFVIFVLIFFLSSCISSRKIQYIQGSTENVKTYQRTVLTDNIIKPGDELYIRVSSFDDIAYNFFSTQTNANYMNYGNDVSIALISYTVNDSGYIFFPILGHIYVKDLTLDQATEKMKVLSSEYFNQPTILMKFVNKRITIMGEVTHPGSYIFTKDHLNIFEALGYAGDINFHGNRKEVFLIRQENGLVTRTKIDMTKDNLLLSDAYYVRSDDILYVMPRTSVKWSYISTPIMLTLSTITTTLLFISFFR